MPPEAVTNYDPVAERSAIDAKRKARPGACRQCGLTPDETKFYPSRKDRCVECIKAKSKAQVADEPKSYSEIASIPVDDPESQPLSLVSETSTPPLDPMILSEIDAMPDLPFQEPNDVPAETSPAAACTCRDCGEIFEQYRNGVAVMTNYCRDCLKTRLKRGIRKAGDLVTPGFKITIDLEQDPEIFEALTLAAKRDRRSLDNQVITLLERSLIQQKGVAPC